MAGSAAVLGQYQHMECWDQLIADSLCSLPLCVGTRLLLSSGEGAAERSRSKA